MKQVIFAIALLAMASLTGCLTDDESSVDETTDTTSDNTGNTNQDGTIDPVGSGGGYSPPETANITVLRAQYEEDYDWVKKDGNRITTSCLSSLSKSLARSIIIYDSDDRIIYTANDQWSYGIERCEESGHYKIDVTLGPEPVKVAYSNGVCYISSEYIPCSDNYFWLVTF